jgi:hypothetical protein
MPQICETVTHVAGPVVTVGGRSIQRCACCGEKLRDNLGEMAPLKPDGTPPEMHVWRERALVHIDGNSQTLAGDYVEIDAMPEDFCLALVE